MAAGEDVGRHALFQTVGQLCRHLVNAPGIAVVGARAVGSIPSRRIFVQAVRRRPLHLHVAQLFAHAQILRGEHGVLDGQHQRPRAVLAHDERRVHALRRGGHAAAHFGRIVFIVFPERIVRAVRIHRQPRDQRVVLSRHAQIRRDGVRARRKLLGFRHFQQTGKVGERVIGSAAAFGHQLVLSPFLNALGRGNRGSHVILCGFSCLSVDESGNQDFERRFSVLGNLFARVRSRQLGFLDGVLQGNGFASPVSPHVSVLGCGQHRIRSSVDGRGLARQIVSFALLDAGLLLPVVNEIGRRKGFLDRLGSLVGNDDVPDGRCLALRPARVPLCPRSRIEQWENGVLKARALLGQVNQSAILLKTRIDLLDGSDARPHRAVSVVHDRGAAAYRDGHPSGVSLR